MKRLPLAFILILTLLSCRKEGNAVAPEGVASSELSPAVTTNVRLLAQVIDFVAISNDNWASDSRTLADYPLVGKLNGLRLNYDGKDVGFNDLTRDEQRSFIDYYLSQYASQLQTKLADAPEIEGYLESQNEAFAPIIDAFTAGTRSTGESKEDFLEALDEVSHSIHVSPALTKASGQRGFKALDRNSESLAKEVRTFTMSVDEGDILLSLANDAYPNVTSNSSSPNNDMTYGHVEIVESAYSSWDEDLVDYFREYPSTTTEEGYYKEIVHRFDAFKYNGLAYTFKHLDRQGMNEAKVEYDATYANNQTFRNLLDEIKSGVSRYEDGLYGFFVDGGALSFGQCNKTSKFKIVSGRFTISLTLYVTYLIYTGSGYRLLQFKDCPSGSISKAEWEAFLQKIESGSGVWEMSEEIVKQSVTPMFDPGVGLELLDGRLDSEHFIGCWPGKGNGVRRVSLEYWFEATLPWYLMRIRRTKTVYNSSTKEYDTVVVGDVRLQRQEFANLARQQLGKEHVNALESLISKWIAPTRFTGSTLVWWAAGQVFEADMSSWWSIAVNPEDIYLSEFTEVKKKQVPLWHSL